MFERIVGLSLVVACGGGGPQVRVDVRTDLVPGVELSEVSIDLLGDGLGDPDLGQTRRALIGDDFIRGVRVAEFTGLRNGERRLRARLFAPDGSSLGDRELSVRVDGNTAVTLVFTRSCVDVTCPGAGPVEATECLNGTCVPPGCGEEECPDVRCTNASDCPSGAECSEPMCIEGACFLAPTGEACEVGFACIPDRGCTPVTLDGGPGCADGAPCSTGNACERGRTDCSSGAAVCVSDGVMERGVVCNATSGECDVEEICDGVAPTCPSDAFAPVGTPCDGGFCNGGVCGACEPGVDCDTGRACETGAIVCEAGTPRCEPLGLVEAGVECRDAAGPCDVAELCDGASAECPSDSFQPAGMTCRGAAGACDQSESCDGSSPACPIDGFAPVGTECRAAAGPCDVAEQCGGGASCPSDARRGAGFVCRPAEGECDSAETCDGVVSTCPDDDFLAAGTSCSGERVCDGSGACLDLGCGDACSTGQGCEIGIIDCSTGSPVCVRDRLRDPGFVCRPVAGACDIEETCSGTDPACPVDAFMSGTTCRPSAGSCDLVESCDGTGPSCPADSVRPNGFECRASTGICDVAEDCDGSSPDCPTDVFVSSSTICRGSAGICDVIERCTGSNGLCPTDGFRSSGVCRPAGMQCDRAESCNGSGASCPADQLDPPGTPCNAAGEFPCHISECDGSGTCEIVGDVCPGGQPCCEFGCNICP